MVYICLAYDYYNIDDYITHFKHYMSIEGHYPQVITSTESEDDILYASLISEGIPIERVDFSVAEAIPLNKIVYNYKRLEIDSNGTIFINNAIKLNYPIFEVKEIISYYMEEFNEQVLLN